MVLRAGEVINHKYKILEEVGHGGMSIVYLSLDVNLNKYWAVKEITKKRTKAGLIEYKALMQESEILKKLNHPFLPRIVDIIDAKNRVFIVMDYLEGHNLRDMLKKKHAFSEEQTIKIGKQLALVLQYLHSQNPKIIYRDMKPSNVMLQPDGNIKLFDFGISREIDQDYKPDETRAMGTQNYASPEQFAHPPYFDERSDIYSLGMTLYRLVSGHNIETSPHKIRPITEWNPDLSKGLEYIILKCTKQDPDDRYQSANELLYDLTHYEQLDKSYKKAQARKLSLFLLSGVLSVSCLIGSGILYGKYNTKQSDDYVSIVQQAEIVKNPKLLEKAYLLKPSKVDAYETAVALYKEDGVFTKEEEEEFLSNLNGNLVELQKTSGYGDLAYQIATLYWFYYQTNDQTQNYVSAIKWFDDAIKYDSKDSKTAKLYSEIGKFYKDIALNVQEATDSGLYNKYWNKIEDILKISYPNDLSNLQIVSLIYDSIESYGLQIVSDGVSRNQIKEGYSKANSLLNKIKPSSEKTIELKKELMERKANVQEVIDTTLS